MKTFNFSKRRALVSLGVTLFVVGGLISGWHIWQYWQQPNAAPAVPTAQITPVPQTASTVSGQPAHISVPSVGISLPIIPGYYNAHAGVWTSSITSAVYAAVTPQPNNQQGNTFIYGHNRASVFESLLKAQVGDSAMLTTSNGHLFTYKLVSVYDTAPTDLSVFRNNGAPTLTLQTCSGLFYQHRRMFVFNLEHVS